MLREARGEIESRNDREKLRGHGEIEKARAALPNHALANDRGAPLDWICQQSPNDLNRRLNDRDGTANDRHEGPLHH